MQKITLIFFFSFVTCIGFSQGKDCSQFKDGTFKVTDPKSKKVCIITREGDTQTEKLEESDETYNFDIKWLDNCTYTLSPTPSTIARDKDVLEAGIMTVRITQVKDGSYIHKITVSNNPKFRRVDEVFVLKQ